MYTALLIGQIIASVFLLTGILLQPNGSGLGTTWSGGGETYHTKRGLERVIFVLTIIMAVLFTALSIALLFVSR